MLASRLWNKSRGFKHNVWDLSDENLKLLEDINYKLHNSEVLVHPNEYVFTNPNNLKLSDAITIDDMGNTIPLSQRDNFLVNDIRFKSGGTIHIKKKNKGKFTDYCGGKVTEECIRKGKNSSNPTTRKRANFAANARKWKHEEGGTINYLNYFN
jgi:hypothetical protein